MVVWSALIINTIVERGPIIFLKLAETINGQYDGLLYPAKQDSGNMDEDEDGGGFENVNGVKELRRVPTGNENRRRRTSSSHSSRYKVPIHNFEVQY